MVNPADLDQIGWQTNLRTRSKLCFPCLICGGENKVQMHHVRHIRKMGDKKPTGFTAVMRALNRKQVPVCEDCHRRVHRGEYDGLSLNPGEADRDVLLTLLEVRTHERPSGDRT